MPFRWDPFQDLLNLHETLMGEGPRLGETSAWTPPIDIFETTDAYIMKAEVPGVKPDSIKLEYHNQRLVLSGEKTPDITGQSRRYHHVERAYGLFDRTFVVPDYVDGTKIEAHYKDGVLEITLPKRPSQTAKSIQISAND